MPVDVEPRSEVDVERDFEGNDYSFDAKMDGKLLEELNTALDSGITEDLQKKLNERQELMEKKAKSESVDKIKDLLERSGITIDRLKAAKIHEVVETSMKQTQMEGTESSIEHMMNMLRTDPTEIRDYIIKMRDGYDTLDTTMDKLLENQAEFHKQLLEKVLEGRDLGEMTQQTPENKIPEDLRKELNEMNTKMGHVQEALKELDSSRTKSSLERVKDALVDLFKILGPLLGVWFLYNLIAVSFSKCYWIPTNKNCKFVGPDSEQFKNINTSDKFKNILPESATPSFYDRLTFHNESKIACKCPDDTYNFVTYSTKSNKYGIVLTNKKNNTDDSVLPFKQNDRTCGANDEHTVPCENEYGNDRDYPICVRSIDSNENVIEWGVTLPKGTELSTSICGGRYEYYECNLSEMINGLAGLVNDVLNVDPSGIFKIIIMIVVGLVAISLIFMIIRMISNRGRKQSFNGRGRGRKRRR